MLERAKELARQYHAAQVDKSGHPYVGHLERVSTHVPGGNAEIVAWLHDIVEDTPMTLESLRDEGFSDEIVAAVDAITHRDGEDRTDYIERVKGNRLAAIVKLADIQDNINAERIKQWEQASGKSKSTYVYGRMSDHANIRLHLQYKATIADLQGQLATAKAPRVYDCGSCAIGKGFEQRVAQLEGEKQEYMQAATNEPLNEPLTYGALKAARFVAKRAFQELVKARADHATLLGLVQALPKVEKVDYIQAFMREGVTSYGLVAAIEALLKYRASLPAQPAQGGA